MYFDSNIFIYYIIFDHSSLEFQKSNQYISELTNGQKIGFTSCITWDEVFYIIKRQNSLDDAIVAGNNLLQIPNLTFLDVNLSIINAAQKIISEFNIMPRDAIHAVSAIEYSSGSIISNDADFDKISGISRMF